MKKLRAGIIGTGGISGAHLGNMKESESAEVVCGCDLNEELVKQKARDFNFKPYTSYEEMLDKEKPDFVILCTTQVVRKEPITACAKRGIPVFTEKPPASDSKTAEEIDKIIKEKKLAVSVGFVFRYLKIVNKAMELLKNRPILILQVQYLASMMYPDSRAKDYYYKRELSGGMIGDQGIHMLDLCRYILQDEIDEVQAFGANVMQPKTKDITTEESAIINLHSTRGALVSYMHTWTHRNWGGKMEIFAPDARLELDLFARKMTGTIDGVDICFVPQEHAGFHFSELDEFARYVKDGSGKILSTFSDSIKTMVLTETVLKSIDDGAVIKI